jgi:hypothetical protein
VAWAESQQIAAEERGPAFHSAYQASQMFTWEKRLREAARHSLSNAIEDGEPLRETVNCQSATAINARPCRCRSIVGRVRRRVNHLRALLAVFKPEE